MVNFAWQPAHAYKEVSVCLGGARWRERRTGLWAKRADRSAGFDQSEEFLYAGDEVLPVGQRIVVVGSQLREQLGFIGCGEVRFAVMEPYQLVHRAMHHQHGNVDPWQLAVCVVANLSEPAHRQPREYFRAYIGDTREGAFQHQSADRFPNRQLRRDPATQRFAEGNYVRARKPLLPQPLAS